MKDTNETKFTLPMCMRMHVSITKLHECMHFTKLKGQTWRVETVRLQDCENEVVKHNVY